MTGTGTASDTPLPPLFPRALGGSGPEVEVEAGGAPPGRSVSENRVRENLRAMIASWRSGSPAAGLCRPNRTPNGCEYQAPRSARARDRPGGLHRRNPSPQARVIAREG